MSEEIPYKPLPPTLSDPPTLGEDLRMQMALQVGIDLPILVETIGEICEIRLAEPQSETKIFANSLMNEDSISYKDPYLDRILLMPLSEKSIGTESGGILAMEPVRGILMADWVAERTMISVKREITRHFYVLKTERLTLVDPKVLQLYLVPVSLSDEVIGYDDEPSLLEKPVEEPDEPTLTDMLESDDGTE